MMKTNMTGLTELQRRFPVPPELEARLLALGGTKVHATGNCEPHAAALLSRGRLFTEPMRLRQGDPHRCHGNAAQLWAQDVNRYRIVVGYGFLQDVWVQHSWVVDDRFLYETTLRWDRYYGAELHRFEALKFWFENHGAERRSELLSSEIPQKLPPGLLDLMAEFLAAQREYRASHPDATVGLDLWGVGQEFDRLHPALVSGRLPRKREAGPRRRKKLIAVP